MITTVVIYNAAVDKPHTCILPTHTRYENGTVVQCGCGLKWRLDPGAVDGRPYWWRTLEPGEPLKPIPSSIETVIKESGMQMPKRWWRK